MTSIAWNGKAGGWGSKTKVPSVAGMDIFWNTMNILSFTVIK